MLEGGHRNTRVDKFGRPVAGPTNDHVEELSIDSLASYTSALSEQEFERAKNPDRRRLALIFANIKVLFEWMSRD